MKSKQHALDFVGNLLDLYKEHVVVTIEYMLFGVFEVKMRHASPLGSDDCGFKIKYMNEIQSKFNSEYDDIADCSLISCDRSEVVFNIEAIKYIG